MTYPDPTVAAFIAEHFVATRIMLHEAQGQALFRAHRVLWTPTVAVFDRRAALHYQSPGYLPPPLFLQMLHIGLARALMAWAGYERAAVLLGVVGDDAASALAPEALYWQGAALYLQHRRRAPMMAVWNRLRERHPASVWAARIPPNQDDGSAPW
ncbi:MAG: thioredoxin family protein [Anaerolineae bacterium]